MKKKLVILLSAVMIVASTVPVMAAKDPIYSPTGTPATETPKKPNPPSKSPKTGEADFMLYGLGGAASLAAVALVAKKKSEA